MSPFLPATPRRVQSSTTIYSLPKTPKRKNQDTIVAFGQHVELSPAEVSDARLLLKAALPSDPNLKIFSLHGLPKGTERPVLEYSTPSKKQGLQELMDPQRIRFTQRVCNNLFTHTEHTVLGLIADLIHGKVNPLQLKPIRVFEDQWGQCWSLDNRRLAAFLEARVPLVRVIWSKREDIWGGLKKRFNTSSKGVFIFLKIKDGTCVRLPSARNLTQAATIDICA